MSAMALRFRMTIACVLALTVLRMACGTAQDAAPAAPVAPGGGFVAADADFSDFADQMLESILEGNVAFLDDHLDVPAMVTRVTAGFDLPPAMLSGLQTRMKEKLRLGTQILRSVQEGDTFRLTRCVKDGNGAKALIRYVGKEGGANWYEFHLVKKPDGRIVYDDVFVALNGEPLSERLKQILYPLLAHESAGTFAKILSGNKGINTYIQSLQTLQAATKLAQEGKAKEGFALYCTLPEAQRYSFQFQVNAIVIVTPLGTDSPEYNQMLTEIYDHSRDNPGAQLMLVDYFFTKKNFAKMRECLTGTGKRFGPDAYLNYLSGASYFFEGNYRKAIEEFKAGRAIEPDLADLYDQEAACYGKIGDHAGMKALWVDFQKAFPEANVEGIFAGESEGMKEFKLSPEYQQMLKECAAVRNAALKTPEAK